MWFKTNEAMINLNTVQQIVLDEKEITFCFVSGHRSDAKFKDALIAASEFGKLIEFINDRQAIPAKGEADEQV